MAVESLHDDYTFEANARKNYTNQMNKSIRRSDEVTYELFNNSTSHQIFFNDHSVGN